MDANTIRWAADIMRQAWQEQAGRAPSDPELFYSLLVAQLETSYGKGWKPPISDEYGDMRPSNNWGAIQCQTPNLPGCIKHRDSFASGEGYDVSFMSYASPLAGAKDLVRHLTTVRPSVWAVMVRGGSTREFAHVMRENRYYEGFCPNAAKRYGKGPVKGTGPVPEGNAARAACAVEAIDTYDRLTLARFGKEISAATGLPFPAPSVAAFDLPEIPETPKKLAGILREWWRRLRALL